MKKLLILFIVMFGVLSATAQIKSQILGCTLGVTTKATTINVLKQKGYDVKPFERAALQNADFYIIKGGVSFANVIWDEVKIRFVNGKFASIAFNTCLDDSQFDTIKDSLISKYKRYKTTNSDPSRRQYYFSDRKTDISFFPTYSCYAMLAYGNINLMNSNTNTSTTEDL
ncbi:MAG: hypothetical protein NC217_07930 [Muribaculaceae bacterium]|nr:hypothetical protein [Muribaculaceae bacterium]